MNPASFKINLTEESTYLRLDLTGEMSPVDHQVARAQAIKRLEETGLMKLFIKATKVKPKMSVSDDYRFTSQHTEEQPKGLVTAIVYNPDEEEKYRFIETVGSNRGLKIKIFTEEDKAMDWMLKQ